MQEVIYFAVVSVVTKQGDKSMNCESSSLPSAFLAIFSDSFFTQVVDYYRKNTKLSRKY